MKSNSEIQTYLRNILKEYFFNEKIKNRKYSLKDFSKTILISTTALSEMMNGKRMITKKTIQKVVEYLDLSFEQKEKIAKLQKGKLAFQHQQKKYRVIEPEQYSQVNKWYYFATLSLAETKDFQESPDVIARRINISVEQAKESLTKLVDFGFLIRDENQKLTGLDISTKISRNMHTEDFKAGHIENIELAKNALSTPLDPFSDFSSMTMAVDLDLLPEAKELIRSFRRKLVEFLESNDKDEIYKLNIQFFPISNISANLARA